MSPYKSFIAAAKTYLESVPFLKFLLSAHIYVFSLGGLVFLLGSFIGGLYDVFTCIGGIIVFAGLLLTLIKEDMLTLIIASASLAFVSLIAWIVGLVTFNLFGVIFFRWHPFLYFLMFGAVAVIVFVKSEKFKQMRAEAAARNEQMRTEAAARAVIPCPRCGAGIPRAAGFCPNCGAPSPAMQYAPPSYAPPAGQPPYAPPAGQYAPPPYPPYAPPAASYAPPPFVPVEPVAPAPPVEPVVPKPEEPAETEEAVQAQAISAEPAPAVKHCVSCGAELPAEAVFCGKCGTKQ